MLAQGMQLFAVAGLVVFLAMDTLLLDLLWWRGTSVWVLGHFRGWEGDEKKERDIGDWGAREEEVEESKVES